ncbi:MAG: MDR family MFS transporter [Rectinemataceae bacterium]|jgi:EmrB/QacA subfamily drug resistance transporter
MIERSIRVISRKTLLLVGLYCGLFVSGLNQSIVGTAMPRIVGELGGFALYAWVTVAYLIAATVSGPLGGKLSDLFGRRPVYITGLLIFMAGSLACGLSSTMVELIAFRAVQGIGGGILFPLVSTIIGDVFSAKERGKWMGLFAVVSVVAQIVGPLVGGALVDTLPWHWIFLVSIPLGLVVLVLVSLGLRDNARKSENVNVDYAGASTMVLGTVSLLLAVSLGGRSYAWLSWQIVGLFGLAIAALASFIAIERKAADPLIGGDLFRKREFSVACIVGFLSNLAAFGVITFLPLFLQGVMGISATGSGLVIAPMMLAVVVAAQACGLVSSRVGNRSLFIVGFALLALGLAWLGFMPTTATMPVFIVAIIALGLGVGALTPTVLLVAQGAFGTEKRGIATSTVNFFRTLGSTIGAAVLGAALNARSTALLGANVVPRLHELSSELGAKVVDSLASKAETDPQGLFTQLLSPSSMNALPAKVREALLPPLKDCLAQSVHLMLLIAAALAVLGIVASLFVRTHRPALSPGEGLTAREEKE